MAENFASLGIKIDSSQAKAAADDLTKLVTAGQGAEGAAKRTGDAWTKAAQAIQGDTGQIATLLKQLNNTQTAALTAMNNYAQALTKASSANSTLASATTTTNAAIGATTSVTKSASAGIDDYIKKLELMNKSQLSAATSSKLIDLSAKGATNAQLNAAKSALDASEIKRSSAAIDEQIKKLQTVAATTGMSARETKLYELALQGATKAQLATADSAIRMNEIGTSLRSGFIAFATAAAAAATAAAAALLVMGKGAIKALAEFKDLSDATGSSISNISALDRIARETGGSFDTVATTLVRFNQVLGSANGKDDASRVFKALGLSLKELKALDPAEALRVTAVAFDKFADGGDKARAVQELFGKSVREVGPFLKDLAEKSELQGTKAAAASEQADKFNKELARLQANSQDAARSLMADLLPALNAIISKFNEGGLRGGLDEFGERAFGWTSNAQRKKIQNITSDIASLNDEAANIKFDLFGSKGAISQQIEAKTAELKKAQIASDITIEQRRAGRMN